MLFNGATTFWETLEGADAFHRAGSLCHGWSAVPVYFYYAYVLGLKPTSPGWKTYCLSPVDSGISSARGRVRTPRGTFEIHVDGCGTKAEAKKVSE